MTDQAGYRFIEDATGASTIGFLKDVTVFARPGAVKGENMPGFVESVARTPPLGYSEAISETRE